MPLVSDYYDDDDFGIELIKSGYLCVINEDRSSFSVHPVEVVDDSYEINLLPKYSHELDFDGDATSAFHEKEEDAVHYGQERLLVMLEELTDQQNEIAKHKAEIIEFLKKYKIDTSDYESN